MFENTQYVDWLSISSDDLAGNILEGESVSINIQADATGLNGGEYMGYVNINSNIQASVQIPIDLIVEVGISGDVNDDGQLNVLDIVQIVNYVLGNLEFSDSQISSADMDTNSFVNVLDVIIILDIILGN